MEKRSKRFLLLALVLAVATAAIIYLQLDRWQQELRADRDRAPVLVAGEDLAARTRLTPDQVEVREVPATAVHEAALSEPGEAAGQYLTRDYVEGEQILSRHLTDQEQAEELTFRIPSGMRALTVPLDRVRGVDGAIRSGDRVDILVTLDTNVLDDVRTIVLLQDIEVLRVGGDQEEGGCADTVTLALLPRQAEELTLADEKGSLRLALRGADDEQRYETEGVRPPRLLEDRR